MGWSVNEAKMGQEKKRLGQEVEKKGKAQKKRETM